MTATESDLMSVGDVAISFGCGPSLIRRHADRLAAAGQLRLYRVSRNQDRLLDAAGVAVLRAELARLGRIEVMAKA